jgi:hypothetical protein
MRQTALEAEAEAVAVAVCFKASGLVSSLNTSF